MLQILKLLGGTGGSTLLTLIPLLLQLVTLIKSNPEIVAILTQFAGLFTKKTGGNWDQGPQAAKESGAVMEATADAEAEFVAHAVSEGCDESAARDLVDALK